MLKDFFSRVSIGLSEWILFLFLTGCSSIPQFTKTYSDWELYQRVCEVGQGVGAVEGTVWVRAVSSEASGQFPASVRVDQEGRLRLEVTNLFGGTEALIEVDHDHLVLTDLSQTQKKEKREGWGSWGGIPLRWAPTLFLGSIPCPSLVPGDLRRLEFIQKSQRSSSPGLTVVVRSRDGALLENFDFTFKLVRDDLWPTRLIWESWGKKSLRVQFVFDDPDSQTRSPRTWEASSSEGSVKVKWRERVVSRQSTNEGSDVSAH